MAKPWGKAEGLELLRIGGVVQTPAPWPGNDVVPPRVDAINLFVIRACRQLRAVYLLSDERFVEEAASLNRDLLDTSVMLGWLLESWEERSRQWAFDDVCQQMEWLRAIDSGVISAEGEGTIEGGLAILEAAKSALQKRGAKRLPKTAQMYRSLNAESLHRRQYKLVSHAFTHPSLFAMHPRTPSLDWSLIVAEPYRMAGLSLWAVLNAAERASSRGWASQLEGLGHDLTHPPQTPADGD